MLVARLVSLIEDNAEAFGGSYKGKKTGTLGDIAGCSFCQNNTLQDGSGDDGELIDHVYVSGTAEVQMATIVYDDAVSVTTSDGSMQMLHRSDHYGVRIDLLH